MMLFDVALLRRHFLRNYTYLSPQEITKELPTSIARSNVRNRAHSYFALVGEIRVDHEPLRREKFSGHGDGGCFEFYRKEQCQQCKMMR